jgi:hypothetical protein
MRSSIIAAGAAIISSAYASPWGHGGLWGGKVDPTKCLTQDSASYLATGFQSLIVAYSQATADKILADDLVDYSNSILSLQGLNLTGGPVFPTKAAFEQGQGAQPSVPLVIDAIDAFNCENVTFRWNAAFPNHPVNGITHLTGSNTQGQKDTWQIKTIYTEFDSISWLLAIGGSITLPSRG